MRQESRLVIAVGHAKGAVGDRGENACRALHGSLMAQDKGDFLRTAFVQQDGDSRVLGNDRLAFVDIDITGLLCTRGFAGALLRSPSNKGDEEATKEFRALI